MQQHVRTLGFLYLAYGALSLLGALIVSVVLGGSAAIAGEPEAAGVLAAVSGVIWIVLLVVGLPYLIAGWGLLRRASWARTLALVLGALALLSFPLGTALGVYAIWALTRPEVEYEFA